MSNKIISYQDARMGMDNLYQSYHETGTGNEFVSTAIDMYGADAFDKFLIDKFDEGVITYRELLTIAGVRKGEQYGRFL